MASVADQYKQLANNMFRGTNVSASIRKSPIELKDNSPTSSLNDDPFHFSSISYPKDVTSDMQNGHYMLFYINVQNKTKYKMNPYDTEAGSKIGETVLHPKGVEKGVVKIKSKNIEKLQNFYGWHFMWSKYYFYKKNNNNIITIINFTPIFIRLILRIFISYLFTPNKTQKYSMRLQGLYASMTGTRSYKRINL